MKARYSFFIVQVLCVILAVVIIIPFLMILINSVKDIREAALFRLSLPSKWMWQNYSTIATQSHILRGFKNSFILCFSVVIIDNLVASMAAFTIQRKWVKARRFVYYLFILGLIVPVSIIPTIKLMMDLHLHNTYPGIILYYTATVLPFSVFLLTGFMKSVPKEIDEAALVEGCDPLRLYFQIIVPMLAPALITVTIVVTAAVWNDFFGPFYLISDSRKWTIILKVFSFISQYQTNWGLVFAFMVLVISPVLVIYLLLQNYIISGLTAGALKG
jgi:raffinose/stachyose/melibiose transport system permease protein